MKTTLLKMAVIAMTLVMTTSAFANRKLCIFGSATRYGWDLGNASPMIQDASNPSVFYYNAWLKPGETEPGKFKFILENTNEWIPTWNKLDDAHIVKRNSFDDPDDQFNISTAGNYSITVDTTLLTISIVPMAEIAEISFNTVFMVGSATPNDWEITEATELTKSATNPFEFSYSGPMKAGELKFPVNRKSGFGQDSFTKASDTQMFLQDPADVKWTITEAGNYDIVINLQTLAISIQKQTTTLSPNHSTSKIALKTNMVSDMLRFTSKGDFNYRIFTASGLTVQFGDSKNGQIDVSRLNSGVFFIEAENNIFKFIKQ